MGKPKKSVGDDEEEGSRQVLQAVVLADSFTQRFRPITVERPKVLLPLVNVPMLNWNLEWLASAGVEEIFVFCSAHAETIKRHLEESGWLSQPSVAVSVIVSQDCLSAGEALRLIDQRNVVRSDFILVNGDVVSNMQLDAVLEAHKNRRKTDKQAIMTSCFKRISNREKQKRLGDTDLVLAIDSESKQILAYEEGLAKDTFVKIESVMLKGRRSVEVTDAIMDCHIDICAPEVLVDFRENFDYQQIRRDFIGGIFSDEVMGNKIYMHELGPTEYGARIHNVRAYDAVSRDIIQRWLYPLVPDNNILPTGATPTSYSFSRGNIYREEGITVARSATLGLNTVLGAGCRVGDGAVVKNCVIGRNTIIGSNCVIEGSYIDANVSVGDDVKMISSLVCGGAVIHNRAQLEPGCIISYNVVVGPEFVVPAHSRLSLFEQEVLSDVDSSDDELEYTSSGGSREVTDDSRQTGALSAAMERAALEDARLGRASLKQIWDQSAVGAGGAGWRWELREGQEAEWISFLAPSTSFPGGTEDDSAAWESDDELQTSMGAQGDSKQEAQQDEEEEEEEDPENIFRREVTETFLRCVRMGYDQSNAVVELNALKLAEDRTFADLARYLITSLLGLALPAPPDASPENLGLYVKEVPETDKEILTMLKKRLDTWGALLCRFLKNHDDQVEVMLTLEEMCDEEGVFAKSKGARYIPVFQHMLKLMYDKDILSEEAIIMWAKEKEGAEEEDKRYLKLAQPFITWLQEADEEESDEEDED